MVVGLDELDNVDNKIFPSNGMYLGLDVSLVSTGVCVVIGGSRVCYNISSLVSGVSSHIEVLERRKLRDELWKLIGGKVFDLVIIEDVYEGVNPSVTRTLYALNTAIDEMILDGLISCKKFIRVDNATWKSWLYSIDEEGLYKSYSDKMRIEACLEMVGIRESGRGYQDRLDATGMLVGYFLCGDKAERYCSKSLGKRVSFGDIEVCYEFERRDVINLMNMAGVAEHKDVTVREWSKSKILDLLTESPSMGFISGDYVFLGKLGEELGLASYTGGGVFGFWVKRDKLRKYVEVC